MLRLIFKNFIRSKGTKIGLLFLLIIGCISLLIGKQFQQKQEKNTTAIEAYQKEHINRNVAFHQDEIGLLLYYVKFSIVNKTFPINSLSIGQRDINPSVQSMTIRGLEAQKYDSELNNPSNLLSGNLDFSFVLIYLFPLLIIAFTYNLISEEKESGTWKMVATQSNNVFKYVWQLFYVRIICIVALYTILLFLAVFFLKIELNPQFALFYTIGLLYILFWFGISFFLVSLQKNSNFNALSLLSLWLFLLIIIPTAINAYVVNKYPIPEALELTVKQRDAYHEKWDMDKQKTVDKFYAHYPQFKEYRMPEGQFNWLWYYAMQQMGDDESAVQTQELETKLKNRNALSEQLAAFVPTMHTQMQFNALAKSDLQNQLFFFDAMHDFHEKLRLHFYPKIFEEYPVKNEDWSKFKVAFFEDHSKINSLKMLLPLLLFILLFTGLGMKNYKKLV